MANIIKINDLVDLVNDLSSKNNGKWFDAKEITRYAHTSQLELFDELVGNTNKRLDNKTNVSYGKSQQTDNRLEPFVKKLTLSVVDGEATLPEDCEKVNAILVSKTNLKALKRVDEDRIGMIMDNPLREPDEDDIYYMQQGRSIQVFGLVDSIYVLYLKTPRKPVYATKEIDVTSGSRTVKRQVYDSVNSVDLEWKENEMIDLATRILAKTGLSMRDGFVEQIVQVNKTNE